MWLAVTTCFGPLAPSIGRLVIDLEVGLMPHVNGCAEVAALWSLVDAEPHSDGAREGL